MSFSFGNLDSIKINVLKLYPYTLQYLLIKKSKLLINFCSGTACTICTFLSFYQFSVCCGAPIKGKLLLFIWTLEKNIQENVYLNIQFKYRSILFCPAPQNYKESLLYDYCKFYKACKYVCSWLWCMFNLIFQSLNINKTIKLI